MKQHPKWEERYRPHRVAECILPVSYKTKFQSFVDQKFIPDIILSGTSGIGKTTVAKAMLDELGFDYLFLNTSLLNGIDVLRDQIMQFASSMALGGSRKYVILDEADRMTVNFQDGLRGFIETYSSNVGYILTCNAEKKIIPAIHSRCELIKIIVDKNDFPNMAKEFYQKILHILDTENVAYDKPVVAQILRDTWPDLRQAIVRLQSYSITGKNKIDTGILATIKDNRIMQLIPFIKDKKWTEVRTWVGENFAYLEEFSNFAREFYNIVNPLLQVSCLPIFVEVWNRYDYQDAFVIDKEINLLAFLTEIMNEVQWK